MSGGSVRAPKPAACPVSAFRGALARVREDIAAVRSKDPAAKSDFEVLFYPFLHALWLYRMASLPAHSRVHAGQVVTCGSVNGGRDSKAAGTARLPAADRRAT